MAFSRREGGTDREKILCPASLGELCRGWPCTKNKLLWSRAFSPSPIDITSLDGNHPSPHTALSDVSEIRPLCRPHHGLRLNFCRSPLSDRLLPGSGSDKAGLPVFLRRNGLLWGHRTRTGCRGCVCVGIQR
jgi:hypothetical protein